MDIFFIHHRTKSSRPPSLYDIIIVKKMVNCNSSASNLHHQRHNATSTIINAIMLHRQPSIQVPSSHLATRDAISTLINAAYIASRPSSIQQPTHHRSHHHACQLNAAEAHHRCCFGQRVLLASTAQHRLTHPAAIQLAIASQLPSPRQRQHSIRSTSKARKLQCYIFPCFLFYHHAQRHDNSQAL